MNPEVVKQVTTAVHIATKIIILRKWTLPESATEAFSSRETHSPVLRALSSMTAPGATFERFVVGDYIYWCSHYATFSGERSLK